ncbi:MULTISPECIES: hypothetical protein [Pelosinus]|uniref:Uncharacterized protein n=1 Tax=Pelosinus fermentans B4 TaxID=1149862 RepID=I9LAZ3_9FIRM|nr:MULTISPECIES: hypothetical protein [Pelosinus]EIW17486.1 hypothetical protein FB4_4235 [Pelosinus fermentans B4]EIW23546.1 hypothetical protein FA11_4238 [Pelosinus fermentans A11]OAM92041.1 hypothetical protein FR7_00055 [Pelosinus fermentans DSM 17108]SDQ31728.1 hypothetical protein SAMN04515679_0082 [Pelosinus fermentans]
MKNIVKNIAVLSMVGMLQVGFGVSVIEASSLQNNSASVSQQSNDSNRGQNRPCLDRNGDREQQRYDLEQARQGRERIENERHEIEMKRHPDEGRRDWKERQKKENERHEENMRRIANNIPFLVR